MFKFGSLENYYTQDMEKIREYAWSTGEVHPCILRMATPDERIEFKIRESKL
jgi:hypothetical protein